MDNSKNFSLNLKNRIVNKFLDENEINDLSNLLLCIFKYNTEERFNARDCLNHKWFNHNWFNSKQFTSDEISIGNNKEEKEVNNMKI